LEIKIAVVEGWKRKGNGGSIYRTVYIIDTTIWVGIVIAVVRSIDIVGWLPHGPLLC
jgi:hypothetical protein